MGLTIFCDIFFTFSLNDETFCGRLLVQRNIVINLINVMIGKLCDHKWSSDVPFRLSSPSHTINELSVVYLGFWGSRLRPLRLTSGKISLQEDKCTYEMNVEMVSMSSTLWEGTPCVLLGYAKNKRGHIFLFGGHDETRVFSSLDMTTLWPHLLSFTAQKCVWERPIHLNLR